MAYSKAKLKSNGDRASPCFKPFLIGNMSDKFLPTHTYKENNYNLEQSYTYETVKPHKFYTSMDLSVSPRRNLLAVVSNE